MKPLILLGFISYGPYHLARLKASRDLLTGMNIEGWELSPIQKEYSWEHKRVDYLHAVTDLPLESVSRLQWLIQVWRHLNQLKPDACVLAGYSHIGMLSALIWCRFHGRPVVVMSDSKEDSAPRHSWLEWCKAQILSLYESALVAGSPHRDYFIKLGYDSERIHRGYDVVDNSIYTALKTNPPGINRPYFLVVSRFIPEKNLSFVLSAFAQYVKGCGREKAWDLVICGDGALRAELEGQIRYLGLADKILLPGFLQMDEMLPFYCHAEVFILASLQETWGLVVNEAMASALPVLLSKKCGCFTDLLVSGYNGYGFDPRNEVELSSLMLQCYGMSPEERRAMGARGRLKIVSEYGLNHFAESLGDCLKSSFPECVR
ncbi:glycosyltransferase family 4 protein [Prosthecobacter dejongeii]|uniref:Glycosyltransferase involved in cell wall biosynthesis n=1 Tax=Prosthecobacter dejongeii TaxID=48465 RepID=A0A7W8DR90_9BACT|nr:glycosyltransferase family 4 protein [Prosthecobacter dejongeii]MBB5039604.1 glycosyltransferase involved in cell wall biosynthesis [Prosthecobacter dejongeii]